MLDRLARACLRRRRIVVLVWLLVLVAAVVGSRVAGGHLTSQVSFGHVEAEQAHRLLATEFTREAGPQATVVVRSKDDVHVFAGRADVEALLARIARLQGVARVQSPYDPDTPTIAPGGHIAFATVRFAGTSARPADQIATGLETLIDKANRPGFEVGLSGEGFGRNGISTGPAELVGLVAAVIVLMLMFGSLLAAGLPLLIAVFALGVALVSLTILARWMTVPVFAPALASMIGLGVGIDYALFIITRYRPALAEGLSVEDAAARALRTAGRAVLFAGATVVVSMLGMLLVGLTFVKGLAVGAALAVLCTMAAAMTLLPALLGFLGQRLNRPPKGRRRVRHDAGAPTASMRWSRVVQRHPVIALVTGSAFLIFLAVPILSLRVGNSDAGSDPPASATRRGYDMLAAGFGPGFNGPLLVVAKLPPGSPPGSTDRLRQAIASTGDVRLVAPSVTNGDGTVELLTTFPKSSPQDSATETLVRRLRAEVIPRAVAGTQTAVYVGGRTAVEIDLSRRLSSRLPTFVGAVLLVSFVLLLTVFRSVVLPMKAVLMNLLSIGAAYGVVVAVFQWGWAAGALGIDRTGPIEPFFPMFLFAILFGLSMDYEVFILSRVHEEYVRTGDNSQAVSDGLAATAKVITAAAAIMVAIFASFMTSDNRIIKLFGLGLTSAILVDATIVRLVVVPASMELMGKANWWLPRWLDRIVPHISIESDEAPSAS